VLNFPSFHFIIYSNRFCCEFCLNLFEIMLKQVSRRFGKMKKFMDEDFLLESQTAKILYEKYAKDMPIIDFHCHLSPKEIYESKRFRNITEVWLGGDHYKWRLMRANGISEDYITGNADDYEKFLAWAKTIPLAIGNPIYHWTHLELKRYFGIEDVLNEKTAPIIWKKANDVLSTLSARDIILKSNVEVICTTDDPVDSLEYHIKLKEDTKFNVKVYPTFRPDKGLNIERETFIPWVEKLGEVCSTKITDYDEFLQAIRSRAEFFHSVGCRVSDHALDDLVYLDASKDEVAKIFKKALDKESLTIEEIAKYKTYTLRYLGKVYSELGWAMQFHINALRNNNTRMFNILGPDTGYDSINDNHVAIALVKFLDSLEKENSLPKTILYSLNPKDNYVLATIMGSFQDGSIPGKMQLGAAWWFNDSKDGNLQQMKDLANLGLLGRFVGMVTDSRSFLSYARHEYFRRLLCNLVGEWVESGEYPYDLDALSRIVQGVCYYNAKEYFGF